MVILMIYHLTGGAWGYLTRRIVEAGMRTLPLVAIMFVPIAWGIRYLYPFAQPEAVAASRQLQHQTFYLTPHYFWLRAGIYFIIWLVVAGYLSAWSRRQDEIDDPRLAWKCRQLSAFGAVAYGVTLHFAAVDWTMSLMPAFHSSIWGPLVALGQLASALAFTLIVLACLVKRPPLAELVSPKAIGDLGTLLLTFVVAWTYMGWFQFMLIWIANLPQDIIFYLARDSRLWLTVIWVIVLLGFAAPFLLLLMRPVKRNIRRLAATAGLVLAMQLLHTYYLVTPSFGGWTSAQAHHRSPLRLVGLHCAATLRCCPTLRFSTSLRRSPWAESGCRTFSGCWLRRPLVVAGDPQRAVAIHLRDLDEEEAARGLFPSAAQGGDGP